MVRQFDKLTVLSKIEGQAHHPEGSALLTLPEQSRRERSRRAEITFPPKADPALRDKKGLGNGALDGNAYKAEIEKLQKIIGKQAIQIEILPKAGEEGIGDGNKL